MPKKLLVLAAVLATLLGMAAPALAQDPGEVPAQDEVPACVLANACPNPSEKRQADADQYTGSPDPAQPFSVSPASDEDQSFTVTSEDNSGFQYNGQPNCSECGERVAQAAQDAITGGDSDTGTDLTDAFGAAMDAARSPRGTRPHAQHGPHHRGRRTGQLQGSYKPEQTGPEVRRPGRRVRGAPLGRRVGYLGASRTAPRPYVSPAHVQPVPHHLNADAVELCGLL